MATAVQLIAACTGVVLLLIAAAWAGRNRKQAVRQLRLAILDPDPGTRKAAVLLAAERGLAPFADLLVERTREETNTGVRRALAEAVARSQWEPADSGPLVDLRVWAHSQLAEAEEPQPAHLPAAAAVATVDVEGARPVTSNGNGTSNANGSSNGNGAGSYGGDHGATEPVITAKARHHHRSGGVTGTLAVDVDLAAHERRARPLRAERPVRERELEPEREHASAVRKVVRRPARLTVLVTGAGGPAGIAVVRALAGAGHRVVAADADPLGAGMRLAACSGVLPRVDDPSYVDRLCDLAFENGARAIVPTLAEELVVLAGAGEELEEVGLESWVPDPQAVETCVDKWRFAEALKAAGVPAPDTNLGSADGVAGPWIVKPRFGRGSRDVFAVDDPGELPFVLARVPDPIVQTRVEGREFTVDALVDRDGTLAGAVPRWRLETKAGISTKGRTFSSQKLTAAVERVLLAVGLEGPANVQGFVHDGRPVFIEINPRFSGGLPLSLAAGADLVGEYVRGVFGEPLRPDRLAFRSGVTMTRHFEESFA